LFTALDNAIIRWWFHRNHRTKKTMG